MAGNGWSMHVLYMCGHTGLHAHTCTYVRTYYMCTSVEFTCMCRVHNVYMYMCAHVDCGAYIIACVYMCIHVYMCTCVELAQSTYMYMCVHMWTGAYIGTHHGMCVHVDCVKLALSSSWHVHVRACHSCYATSIELLLFRFMSHGYTKEIPVHYTYWHMAPAWNSLRLYIHMYVPFSTQSTIILAGQGGFHVTHNQVQGLIMNLPSNQDTQVQPTYYSSITSNFAPPLDPALTTSSWLGEVTGTLLFSRGCTSKPPLASLNLSPPMGRRLGSLRLPFTEITATLPQSSGNPSGFCDQHHDVERDFHPKSNTKPFFDLSLTSRPQGRPLTQFKACKHIHSTSSKVPSHNTQLRAGAGLGRWGVGTPGGWLLAQSLEGARFKAANAAWCGKG